MVSDGFTADLDALGAVRERIGRLTDELAGPPRDLPDAEVFGHDRLHAAVGTFADKEKDGLAAIAEETDALRAGLTETIRVYRAADEDGAGRFRS